MAQQQPTTGPLRPSPIMVVHEMAGEEMMEEAE